MIALPLDSIYCIIIILNLIIDLEIPHLGQRNRTSTHSVEHLIEGGGGKLRVGFEVIHFKGPSMEK